MSEQASVRGDPGASSAPGGCLRLIGYIFAIYAFVNWTPAAGIIIFALVLGSGAYASAAAQRRWQQAERARIQSERDAVERFKTTIRGLVGRHEATLRRKRMQLVHTDDYGNTFTDAWEREIEYFLLHVVSPEFTDSPLSPEQTEVVRVLLEEAAQRPWEFGENLDAASMDPNEYEHFCAQLLRDAGWNARVTVATGDQGVDVVATRDGKTLVVQAKRYSGNVGNAAVQQAFAGKQFMGAEYAAVVSPAPFTRSAAQLANSTGVALLHHEELSTFEPAS